MTVQSSSRATDAFSLVGREATFQADIHPGSLAELHRAGFSQGDKLKIVYDLGSRTETLYKANPSQQIGDPDEDVVMDVRMVTIRNPDGHEIELDASFLDIVEPQPAA